MRRFSSRSSPGIAPTAGVHHADSRRSGAVVSGCDVVLPDGGHREPGAQLRLVVADRRAGAGLEARRGLRLRRAAARHDSRTFPAPPTCTSSRCSTIPTLRLDVDRQRASQAGPEPERRRQQRARLALVERARGAVVLHQSDERRELSRRREGAAGRPQLGSQSPEHADDGIVVDCCRSRKRGCAGGAAARADADARQHRATVGARSSERDRPLHRAAGSRRRRERRRPRPRLGRERHPGEGRGARKAAAGNVDRHSRPGRGDARGVHESRSRA